MRKVTIEEIRREQKIRRRRSYAQFKELIEWLQTSPSIAEVAELFWKELDRRHAFGSIQNAICAKESMKLALEDAGVV